MKIQYHYRLILFSFSIQTEFSEAINITVVKQQHKPLNNFSTGWDQT